MDNELHGREVVIEHHHLKQFGGLDGKRLPLGHNRTLAVLGRASRLL
jgi:hypothetical protein